MRAMHELEGQHTDGFPYDTAPTRSDLPQPAGTHTGAAARTEETFSVRLLATHDHHQHAAVLSVQGEIDLGTAPKLREALLPVLEHHTGPVVVDLSDVGFMDSTGVHVLIETLERLKLENRQLAIACSEGGQVHRLLALVGLLDTLRVYHPRESAATGEDDGLRPEPRRTRRPSTEPALTQRPPSVSPAAHHASKAS